MIRYSVQISVKDYVFKYFAKKMVKNVGKNIIKDLSNKYSQKNLDHTKQSAIDTLETTSKRAIQKNSRSNR